MVPDRRACVKVTLNLRAALETQKLVPIKSGVTRLKYILLRLLLLQDHSMRFIKRNLDSPQWGNWSLIHKSLWHYKFPRNRPSHVSHPAYLTSVVRALTSSAVETRHVSFMNVQLLLHHNSLPLLYCPVITDASSQSVVSLLFCIIS